MKNIYATRYLKNFYDIETPRTDKELFIVGLALMAIVLIVITV